MAKKVKGNKVNEVTFPEVGTIEESALRKLYKKLTDDQIREWLELEGISHKQSEHESINRMRMCMAITNHHFPKEPAKTKKTSKYSDYSTDQLVQMCMENDLSLRDDKGDVRILRMYCIMALREAGVIG